MNTDEKPLSSRASEVAFLALANSQSFRFINLPEPKRDKLRQVVTAELFGDTFRQHSSVNE